MRSATAPPKARRACAICWRKGANLAEMANLKLPVPPGFTINDRGLHLFLRQQAVLSARAESTGGGGARCGRAHHRKTFGDDANPLLVSVRFGRQRASMPGMMDTVLNLGSTT